MAPENGTTLEEEILILEIIRFFQVNHLFNFGGVNLVAVFFAFQLAYPLKRISLPVKKIPVIKGGMTIHKKRVGAQPPPCCLFEIVIC